MGACFYVEYKLNYKDKEKVETSLRNYIKRFKDVASDAKLNEVMSFLLKGDSRYSDFQNENDTYFSSSFDANYLYEIYLSEAFITIQPYLSDDSYVYIEPDCDQYKLITKNGQIIDTRNRVTRGLTKSDFEAVEKLDEESGFNVFQFIEDLDDDEEADNAFGLFYENELIGYCSLGYADGAVDLPDISSEDRCLSDVYVVPKYRNMGFCYNFLSDIFSDYVESDVYLYFLEDWLVTYYESLEFEKVDGTDNLMVRNYT